MDKLKNFIADALTERPQREAQVKQLDAQIQQTAAEIEKEQAQLIEILKQS